MKSILRRVRIIFFACVKYLSEIYMRLVLVNNGQHFSQTQLKICLATIPFELDVTSTDFDEMQMKQVSQFFSS